MQEEEIRLDDKSRDIVVIVVEGPSDKLYLEVPMSLIFENKYGSDASFVVLSDFTGDYLYENQDVSSILDKYVEGELRKPKFKMSEEIAKHIVAVYHIIDIDQSYVSEDLIHKGDFNSFHYSSDGIHYCRPEEVSKRNRIKRQNIEKLLLKKNVDLFNSKIQYHLFYYSVNIDHFYYDKLNISDEEKYHLARTYSEAILNKQSESGRIKKFYSDIDGINPPEFPKDYKLTWDYIQCDNNCLKRCTNVFLIK